jgi:two-component system nitrate/nitrite response regulator NarL
MKAILLVENSTVFQTALRLVLIKLGFSVFIPPQHLHLPQDEVVAVFLDAITFGVNSRQFESLVREYSRIGPVLFLASEDHVEQIVAGLRGGAVGFLKSTASPRDLCAALRAVSVGRAWCDVDLLRLVAQCLPIIPVLRMPIMTKREREVLNCVKSGHSNKVIAQHLGVTEQSVKVYVSNLLRKTGASSRHELAYLSAGASSASGID